MQYETNNKTKYTSQPQQLRNTIYCLQKFHAAINGIPPILCYRYQLFANANVTSRDHHAYFLPRERGVLLICYLSCLSRVACLSALGLAISRERVVPEIRSNDNSPHSAAKIKKDASFGAHHKNLNDDRPQCQCGF